MHQSNSKIESTIKKEKIEKRKIMHKQNYDNSRHETYKALTQARYKQKNLSKTILSLTDFN